MKDYLNTQMQKDVYVTRENKGTEYSDRDLVMFDTCFCDKLLTVN